MTGLVKKVLSITILPLVAAVSLPYVYVGCLVASTSMCMHTIGKIPQWHRDLRVLETGSYMWVYKAMAAIMNLHDRTAAPLIVLAAALLLPFLARALYPAHFAKSMYLSVGVVLIYLFLAFIVCNPNALGGIFQWYSA